MELMRKKATAFRALHDNKGTFIIPNPYDAGSAVLLEKIGFKALATTSAGFAFSRGVKDNNIGRDAMITHARDIVAATSLPVSADLENGFFDSPREVARTIELAAGAGLVGGSIEDSTNDDSDEPLYSIGFAKERMTAAAEAKATLPHDFVLTGRAENYLVGRPFLDDVIARLQAYQEAGADVLFAPGLTCLDDIASVVANVDRPVNVIAGRSGDSFTMANLSALGVKRISVGSALSRAAFGAIERAGREMIEKGSFTFAEQAIPFAEINAMFEL